MQDCMNVSSSPALLGPKSWATSYPYLTEILTMTSRKEIHIPVTLLLTCQACMDVSSSSIAFGPKLVANHMNAMAAAAATAPAKSLAQMPCLRPSPKTQKKVAFENFLMSPFSFVSREKSEAQANCPQAYHHGDVGDMLGQLGEKPWQQWLVGLLQALCDPLDLEEGSSGTACWITTRKVVAATNLTIVPLVMWGFCVERPKLPEIWNLKNLKSLASSCLCEVFVLKDQSLLKSEI